jgi:lipoate-protein ligase A
MNDTWYLWQDGSRSPQLNMAIDDVLLQRSETESTTVLRLYDWSEPAHTIGYFQPLASAGSGSTVIRRPSGGGVVDHRNDFTFTLVFSQSDYLFQCDRFESYRLINDAVRNALLTLGVECFLFGGDVPKDFDRSFLVCFQQPAKFDVINRGGKLCGGAQRRKRYGMLHQGSILLDQLPGITKTAIGDALVDAFSTAFSITMEPFSPEPDFLEQSEELALNRYASDKWNRRK